MFAYQRARLVQFHSLHYKRREQCEPHVALSTELDAREKSYKNWKQLCFYKSRLKAREVKHFLFEIFFGMGSGWDSGSAIKRATVFPEGWYPHNLL